MTETQTGYRTIRLALACAGLMTLASACAQVEIHGGDGAVRVERHWGVLSIDLTPDEGAQLVASTGIGFVSDGRQAILGYHDVELATLGDGCRLVLWIEQNEHLTAAYELFGDRPDLCVVSAFD